MLSGTYYSQNYASIIRPTLLDVQLQQWTANACIYARAALGSYPGHSSLFVARFDSANHLFIYLFLKFFPLLENLYGHGRTGRTGGAGPE